MQPRINRSIPPPRTARHRRDPARLPRRDLRARSRARGVRGKGADVLALLGRALEPGDEIEALYEGEVLDCAAGAIGSGEGAVEREGCGVVVGDGDFALQPGEVDGAQVDGGGGGGETRWGREGEGRGGVGEVEVLGGGEGEVGGGGSGGGEGGERGGVGGDGLAEEEERVLLRRGAIRGSHLGLGRGWGLGLEVVVVCVLVIWKLWASR